jgi:hypothetical protein
MHIRLTTITIIVRAAAFNPELEDACRARIRSELTRFSEFIGTYSSRLVELRDPDFESDIILCDINRFLDGMLSSGYHIIKQCPPAMSLHVREALITMFSSIEMFENLQQHAVDISDNPILQELLSLKKRMRTVLSADDAGELLDSCRRIWTRADADICPGIRKILAELYSINREDISPQQQLGRILQTLRPRWECRLYMATSREELEGKTLSLALEIKRLGLSTNLISGKTSGEIIARAFKAEHIDPHLTVLLPSSDVERETLVYPFLEMTLNERCQTTIRVKIDRLRRELGDSLDNLVQNSVEHVDLGAYVDDFHKRIGAIKWKVACVCDENRNQVELHDFNQSVMQITSDYLDSLGQLMETRLEQTEI